MAKDHHGAVLRQIDTLFNVGNLAGLSDGELLERFAARDGEAAERAFAALVRRHGPMVLHACRGIVRDPHEAQDAFQATFLILARKGRTLWVRDSLGPWLHGVACRVAAHARSATARRRRHERRAAERAVRPIAHDHEPGDDLGPAIHEEIARLPAHYRGPIVLCDLGGLTHEQAARQLGLPAGTVKSRLSRGRGRLRARLIRRGLAPSAGLLGATLSAEAAVSAVSPALCDSTARHALRFAASRTAAGAISTAVAGLTEGALRMMFLTKLKLAVVASLAIGAAACGGFVLAFQAPGNGKPPGAGIAEKQPPPARTVPGPEPRPQPPSEWSERLRDELELLTAQLEAKKAELEWARAQQELALTVIATHERLNKHRPGMVSKEELRKAELEEAKATAQVAIEQAGVREIELRRNQLKRMEDRPERLKEYYERMNPTGSPALERRLREVERKLDRLIEALDGPNRENPRGSPVPPRR